MSDRQTEANPTCRGKRERGRLFRLFLRCCRWGLPTFWDHLRLKYARFAEIGLEPKAADFILTVLRFPMKIKR